MNFLSNRILSMSNLQIDGSMNNNINHTDKVNRPDKTLVSRGTPVEMSN